MHLPLKVSVEEKTVLEKNSFFFTGPPLEEGELPALFYFSSTGKSSLSLDPYNQIAQFLLPKKIRIFSWDLPFHTEPFNSEKAFHDLVVALQKKENPFPSFFQKSEIIISYLLEKKYINPSSCITSGLSRGAFFALHLASLFSFPFSVNFAPLIRLEAIEELSFFSKNDPVKKYALTTLLDSLSSKDLSFFIGNFDQRVKTHFCFSFFEKLVERAFAKKIRSPKIELFSYPSVGHLGHGTPAEIFQKGANWICQKMSL